MRSELLIQDIRTDAAVLDMGFLNSGCLIESLDLSGPKLILKFNDRYSLLRDGLKIREGDVLDVLLADWEARDGLEYRTRFTVMETPLSHDHELTLNCMQTDIAALKRRSTRARLFHDHVPGTIVRGLLPHLAYDIDSYPGRYSSHLLPGDRRGSVLKQLAADLGSVIFYDRGTVRLQQIDSLMRQQPVAHYYYNDARQPNQIHRYELPGGSDLIRDYTYRRHAGWDIRRGPMRSRLRNDAPVELMPSGSQFILDHRAEQLSTVLDFQTLGNGQLRAGSLLDLSWHKEHPTEPLDESLPTRILIRSVSHMQIKTRYYCRVLGALPV